MRDAVRVGVAIPAAIFSLATVGGVLWNDVITVERYYSDFAFIWPAGQIPIERLYAEIHDLAFAYPPSSLLLIAPFSKLPFVPALVLWSILGSSLLFFAAAKLTSPRIAALSLLTPAWVVSALSGQTSLFVSALTILGVVERRPWIAGLCFAAAGMIKPQALIVLPIALLASKQWREVLWTAAGASTVFIVTLLLWGFQPWLDWVDALPRFQDVLVERDIIQQGIGPNGLTHRFGLPVAVYWLGIALGVACVWAAFKSDDKIDRYAALVCASALISPYMLHYDLAGLGAAGIAMLLDRHRPVLIWIGAALAISYLLAPFGIIVLAVGLLIRRLPLRQRLPNQATAERVEPAKT